MENIGNLDKRYSLSSDFVADEHHATVAAIMNLNTGEISEIQGSGTAIVYGLVHGQTQTEIVSNLGMTYDVEEQLAKRDVHVMLEQLLNMGALVASSAKNHPDKGDGAIQRNIADHIP